MRQPLKILLFISLSSSTCKLTVSNRHFYSKVRRSEPKLFISCSFHMNKACTCKYPEHKEKLLKSLSHYLYPEASHNLYAPCQVLSVKAEVIIRMYESRCHFWQVVRWLYMLSCDGIKMIPKKSVAGHYFTSSIYVKLTVAACTLVLGFFFSFLLGILIKDSSCWKTKTKNMCKNQSHFA